MDIDFIHNFIVTMKLDNTSKNTLCRPNTVKMCKKLEPFLLLLLLLSRFSRVQLCATPQTAAHQAPPSLGFSRQEHKDSVIKVVTQV